MQTDVCGIKWAVFREEESHLHRPPSESSPPHPPSASPAPGASRAGGGGLRAPACSEDQVLSSYARCLDKELLAVWRRVPKRALVTFTCDLSGQVGTTHSRFYCCHLSCLDA